MKESMYKHYEDLPLFLNAATVAKVLGVSPSSGYELMHESRVPGLTVGSRMVVPKAKIIQWVEDTQEAAHEYESRDFSLCPQRYSLA